MKGDLVKVSSDKKNPQSFSDSETPKEFLKAKKSSEKLFLVEGIDFTLTEEGVLIEQKCLITEPKEITPEDQNNLKEIFTVFKHEFVLSPSQEKTIKKLSEVGKNG